MYRIALIPGDGIGKEVVPAAARVLEETGLPIHFVELEAGWETFQRTGSALPDETVAGLKKCHGALFGAVSSPSHRVPGYSSPIVALRRILDLHANLRPVVSAPVPGSRPGVDMLIVRENTECLYVKRERLEDDGATAIAERVITRRASERIARMAFELAERRQKAKGAAPSINSGRRLSLSKGQGKRALVTIVHKANVLSVTDGLFREAALAVAEEFPHIAAEEQLVDSMAYRMILEPERYDVVVAPNLYGDILSDAGAALVGGLGLVPSANVGESFVLAEPVHGSAPDIADRGIANPLATIRAAALLLAHLGEGDTAQAIESAVQSVLTDGPRTADLGGSVGTEEVTKEVICRIDIG